MNIQNKIIETILKYTAQLEYRIDKYEFVKRFIQAGGSEVMGTHMYNKFSQYGHRSLTRLYKLSDSANRPIIAEMIRDFIWELT